MVVAGDGAGDHVVNWHRNPDGPEAADEIERLQKVIDDYVYIAKASAKEIKQLRNRGNV